MSAIAALEAEIRRVLSADAGVTDKFGSPPRLVDGETARAAFPFIRLARHETRPKSSDETGATEHRLSLEVFSRSGGRNEASQLLAQLADALRTAELSPAGHRLVLFYPVYLDVFQRADGTTYRGLLRLRALTEPVAEE